MNLKDKIEVLKGDITKLEVDAIVNAANNRLAGGGGVDGAIHRAAGKELAEACAKLDGCKTGEVKATKGFRLSVKYIIHTVAPVWHGGLKGEPELLEQCYINSLQWALKHDLKTIAFPNLGTGIYMYPKDKAAEIAIDTVSNWLKSNNVPEKVIFCCFEEDNYLLYKSILG
ncbi:MAG: O-acetyl-ADP-ribose deacetylase [Bacteroidales bacterium]|nr:O-acetyl-ADP-ribose deacetylase [Bacteroidales bacterium]